MRGAFGTIHPDCSSSIPLPVGANCTKYLWTRKLNKKEWSELFPDTNFYLIGLQRIENPEDNMIGLKQVNSVIALQDGSRYTIDSYDKLLASNSIAITDDVHEQIAQSFALMSLGNFLDDEILFLNWEMGSWRSPIRLNFDHKLSVWTKIQGCKVDYFFGFYEDRLVMIEWHTTGCNSSDYIEKPAVSTPGGSIYFKQN
jgi:hypothetical protein